LSIPKAEENPIRRWLPSGIMLLVLFAEGFLLGQHRIPTEDGGEILTVACLGGTCHPPGMPLVSLITRGAYSLLGENGIRAVFASAAAISLWLLFRRSGLCGMLFSIALLASPDYRIRLLQWDAYGLLFLCGAVFLAFGRMSSLASGYLTGFSAAIHPQGLFLFIGSRIKGFTPAIFLSGLILSGSIYLTLPVSSAAGSVVDWGSPSTLASFMQQVSATNYREYYSGRMGFTGITALPLLCESTWQVVWPALIVPSAIGMAIAAKRQRSRMLRLLALLLVDILFILLINPMAAGTSQTGWLTMLVLAAFSALALEEIPRSVAYILAFSVGIVAVVKTHDGALPEQDDQVGGLISCTPLESCLFIKNNDLLYGGWVTKYVRDLRPDIGLLSPDNFSAWFEGMACRYAPGLDLSAGVSDVGGVSVGRDSAARGLIRLTARDNPGRRIIVIE
jgi:hypothetical protein